MDVEIMKRITIGFLVVFLSLATCLAQENRQFYAGITGGIVFPGNLNETWHNIDQTQSADLIHSLNDGFILGARFGYTPTALRKILAIELEYSFQTATVDRITSNGFTADTAIIPAFSSNANHSSASFNSLFLNIIARYPGGKVQPYLGFGPGITRSYISFDEPNLVGSYGLVESADDTGFSYQILFGADIDITSKISLGGSYKYFAVKPTMTWQNGTHSHYEYSSHNIVADLKFHF